MRIPVWITLIVALVSLGAVLVAGQALLQPDLPLITAAEFSLEAISPNADGSDDIAEFTYSLSRAASVSLALENENGETYFFRKDQPRTAGDHAVLFSGVVDGFTRSGETIAGEVIRRLMPDGNYSWRLSAVEDGSGETHESVGKLVITGGDSPLPELRNFTVSPETFTPNQDGIDDRAQINLYLSKPAQLTVYLQTADGAQIFIPERKDGRQAGEPGRHAYDYDGGIDQNIDPPPDGTYTLIAEAQDAAGQIVRQTTELTIRNGGDPQAEIVPQSSGPDVVFVTRPYDDVYFSAAEGLGQSIIMPDSPADFSVSAVTMPVGDLLVFRLTVENYGDVPIRTSGPPPGTVYEQKQVAATLGWYDQSGAWRIGIDCDTATRDYPWRWAIGTVENLTSETDSSGNTYYYLPPGQRSEVWGAIRMTELIVARNPQQCWAGLIHEDVEVSIRNSRVGARDVELVSSTLESGG